ncbi:probable xyloglucan galactosyltransferase GT20 [Coffea eugenioides]|uniref:probable xyloglucan galactosyltransferase GT20 n=1 Tax=Coffea eugenioides TaxID=49369 RepID=UPI000F6152C6|nr:probable xyloglucan galactosyltransferase GT20 [Coffea eugenioides]
MSTAYMAVVSVGKKKSRASKKVQTEDFALFHSLAKILFRIPAALFLLILIFLWSTSTTFISGNILHVCLSSRKLNNLYCISAGTQPNFHIPVPLINGSSASITREENDARSLVQTTYNIYKSSNKYLDEEVMTALNQVEDQLRIHRSWISFDQSHTNCDGRGVYVYELPPKFNKDILAQCGDIFPWANLCKYFSNDALGEPIQKLGKGWYHTHQYSLEPIFHSRVLKHTCRVYNENEAKLFYVPFYGGLDILRWNFKNVSDDVKDSLSSELIRWLETQKPWFQKSGKDHVFVLGKITWDFRRYDRESWGTRFLELDEMQNPIKLLIERQPWRINDIGIPHPTYFHPQTDDDIITWQLKLIRSRRGSLVSFAGAARSGAPKNIRSILIEQCTSARKGNCRFLNCGSGACDQPESLIEIFMESEFCLQPPGDSATRKSVFDSLISGCIPVLFDPFTAYYQYAWHLPEDHEKYSVFIDEDAVRNRQVNFAERLEKIPIKEREDMRRYIVYDLLPGLLYGDSNSKLEKFQDAFSITMNNLIERVNRL